MSRTPYEILGVGEKASQDEIKNAYRKLAKKFHPDLNPGNKSAEKSFKEISGAYEKIGSPEERLKFDRGESPENAGPGPGAQRGPFYHQTQQGGGRYSQQFSGSGFDEDFLNSIFGQMGGGQSHSSQARQARPERGADETYQMEIDFKDAVLGAEREITLPSGKKLRVKIPAGVDSGTRLRFGGQGGPGAGQAPAGDAYVQLNVRPSSQFKRQGHDLEIELAISISEAVLGGEIKVPTIDGSILLKVPAGVSSGQKLRVPGKGIPYVGAAGKRGDEIVSLKIVAPATIDAEFRQAVESWQKRQPFHARSGESV